MVGHDTQALKIEMLEHTTTYYNVYFIPPNKRKILDSEFGFTTEGNFEVRNRKYGTIEFITDNLPTALTVAEQFNANLEQKMYLNTTSPETREDAFDNFFDMSQTKGTVQ